MARLRLVTVDALGRRMAGVETRAANIRCAECGTTIDGPVGNPYPWCCLRWWCSEPCHERHVQNGHRLRLHLP